VAEMAIPRDWREIWSGSKTNRINFKGLLCLYGLAVYWLVICAIHYGWPWVAGLGELLASLIPLFLCGWLREDSGAWVTRTVRADGQVVVRSQLQKLSPFTQSWALLADTYGLAPMAAFRALASPLLPHNTLFNGSLWLLWSWVTLALGAVGAYLFSRNEGNVYDVLRRNSYTKLLHNGVAWTVLCGIVLNTLVPILFAGWGATNRYHWFVLAGFLLWLVSSLGDGWRAGLKPGSRFYFLALLPENLHPQADEHGRRLAVEIAGVMMWNKFRGLRTGEDFDMSDVLHAKRWIFHASRILSPLAFGFRRGSSDADEAESGQRRRPGHNRFRRKPRSDDRPNRPG
jgi:hypothetical protein